MRLVIQRVSQASVKVAGEVVGEIGKGLLVFLGISQKDHQPNYDKAIDKLCSLRLFPKNSQSSGTFESSVEELGLGLLIISQFTLYADCTTGRRPSLNMAMPPAEANLRYQEFLTRLKSKYSAGPIAEGIFGAEMQVELQNDGPITLILDFD